MALSPFSNMIPTATEDEEEAAIAAAPPNPPMPPLRDTPARQLEREIISAAQSRPRGYTQERHEALNLTNQLNAQSLQIRDFYGVPGVSHTYMDPRTLKSASDLWNQAETQAERRDRVFAIRQESLNNIARKEQSGSEELKADPLAATVTKLQMKFEDAAQDIVILQDAQKLNDALHQTKGQGWTKQIEAALKTAQHDARFAEGQWKYAVDHLKDRPAHEQRQQAYKDLQKFAVDQGAGRAAEFLDKYREFKQAQFDLKSAYASGNVDRIEQARDNFREARQAGIEAKGTLQVSEVAKLGAAYRMRMEQPRLFTQTAEKVVEQKTQVSAKRQAEQEAMSQQVMAGTGIEAMRERGQRLVDAGFGDHESFRSAAMRSNAMTQNALTLAQGGMDRAAVVEMAFTPQRMERAADLMKAGFKDNERIERLSSNEKLTERALYLKPRAGEVMAEKIANDDKLFRDVQKSEKRIEKETEAKISSTDSLRASTAKARQEHGISDNGKEQGNTTDALRASTAKAREEAEKPKTPEKEKDRDGALTL